MKTTKWSATPGTARRRSWLAIAASVVVGVATLATGTAPAMADTPCTDRTTSAAFSFLGDYNQYFSAPGGNIDNDFEWRYYGGSWPVWGVNSPLNLAGGWNSRSGWITGGGTMLSTWTCVKGNEDTVRFLIKPTGANAGPLTLRLYVSDPSSYSGSTIKTVTFSPSSPGTAVGNGWYVTPRVSIPWSPYWDNTQWISFNFINDTYNGGGWYIDDVMIDPWRTN